MAEIVFNAVRKQFGKVAAVDGVDLTIEDGEFMVLLGPSGCGKTTLLRCLAGLETVDGGSVLIGGRDVTGLPPRSRRIAMVFQSYAVFPHMRVRDNISFGLRMHHEKRDRIAERVASVAELMSIDDLLDRYPSQLSGGQRQRVAVARAIASGSDVLLMDEPLSNLDALLRLKMRAELKGLLKQLGSTVVYVTHDQVEALSMGDRIAVMNGGRIAQADAPLAVYEQPSTVFVGSFVGAPPMNFVEAEISRNGTHDVVRVGAGEMVVPHVAGAMLGRKMLLGIRAEAIEVAVVPVDNGLPATVAVFEPLGATNLLTVDAGSDTIKVSVPPQAFFEPGSRIWLHFDPARIRWMDAEGGSAVEAVPADQPVATTVA